MITHNYVLNQTNQLVDINDSYSSFSTMYNVSCDNVQDSFEYAIVNQSMLDNNQIYFKKTTGIIEDSFTINNNVFENWYLVLKAGKDTPCKVSLEITPLEFNTTPPQQPQSPPQQSTFPSATQYMAPPPFPQRAAPQSMIKTPRPMQQKPKLKNKLKQKGSKPVKKTVKFELDDTDSEQQDDENNEKIIENFEESNEKYSFFTKYSWSKIIFIGIGICILFLFVLWWTNKLHYIPFLNKYFKQPVLKTATVIVPTSHPVIIHEELPQPQLPQPQPQLPQLPQSQPPSQILEEKLSVKNPNLDSNFINEMRELKINV